MTANYILKHSINMREYKHSVIQPILDFLRTTVVLLNFLNGVSKAVYIKHMKKS